MNYNNRYLAFLFFAAGLPTAHSQPRLEAPRRLPPPPLKLYEAPPRKPVGLNLEVSAGMGTFQDLQAPVGPFGDVRSDGTTTVNDSSAHNGVLLAARLDYKSAFSLGQLVTGVTLQRAASTSPVTAPSAAYVRYSLDGGINWSLTKNLSLLSAVELRRSIFRNTDNGHYLDGLFIRGGLTQEFLTQFAISGHLGFAPVSRFGYMQDAGRGRSGTFKNTRSSAQEFGGRVSWTPSQDAQLFLSSSQERIQASISDVQAYQTFGLNVSRDRFEPTERNVDLTTTLFSVGAVRRF